jgi:hypothetical protein
MKESLQNLAASLIRYGLGAYAGWVAAQSAFEFAIGDPSAVTVIQFVTGLVLVGLTFAMKKIEGTHYGPFINTFVGPRAAFFAHSIARGIVAVLAGALAAWLGEESLTPLEPGLADDSVVGLVVLLVGLAHDRVSKKLRP